MGFTIYGCKVRIILKILYIKKRYYLQLAEKMYKSNRPHRHFHGLSGKDNDESDCAFYAGICDSIVDWRIRIMELCI